MEYMTESGRPQQVHLSQCTSTKLDCHQSVTEIIGVNVAHLALWVLDGGSPGPLFLILMGNSTQTSISSLLFVLACYSSGV